MDSVEYRNDGVANMVQESMIGLDCAAMLLLPAFPSKVRVATVSVVSAMLFQLIVMGSL